jgi:hypothetical protein
VVDLKLVAATVVLVIASVGVGLVTQVPPRRKLADLRSRSPERALMRPRARQLPTCAGDSREEVKLLL